jgi:hypothetical protein
MRVDCSESDAPEVGRFATARNASFSEQNSNVAVAAVGPEEQPDNVAYDVMWKSMAFVGIYSSILSI